MADRVAQMDACLEELFPILRSLTGPGNRETLRILQGLIPLDILEYPSGDKVFDWEIPEEWHLEEAWIRDADGRTVVDVTDSNIHIVSYSESVAATMTLAELEPRLHSIPNLRNAIPYRTTYYKRDWGFGMTQEKRETLAQYKEPFKVCIRSKFSTGSMSVGELLIPGISKREVLISTYFCHPSLANDNLSGVVLTAFLARELLKKNLYYSYRIIFVPETVGAIAYCAKNQHALRDIDLGLVVSTVGGPGPLGVKQGWEKDHYFNKMATRVAQSLDEACKIYPFDIHGSDERQFSSPGFRIHTVSITKDKYYCYPYYHTSLDNLEFVKAEAIDTTLEAYLKLIQEIEQTKIYRATEPHCEAMLSKRGLYPDTGGAFLPGESTVSELDAILWTLWSATGWEPMCEVAQRLGVSEESLAPTIAKLEAAGLLERV